MFLFVMADNICDTLYLNSTSKLHFILLLFLFLTDIGINFTTTFVSKTGVVVYERRAIAIHYAKTWFFIDILAAVPFDFIVTVSNINTVRPVGDTCTLRVAIL